MEHPIKHGMIWEVFPLFFGSTPFFGLHTLTRHAGPASHETLAAEMENDSPPACLCPCPQPKVNHPGSKSGGFFPESVAKGSF